ncbi:MAG: hypothetical protein ACOC2U_01325, partial [bacterium]
TVAGAGLLVLIAWIFRSSDPGVWTPISLIISASISASSFLSFSVDWEDRSNTYYREGQKHQNLFKKFNYFVKIRLPDPSESDSDLEDRYKKLVEKVEKYQFHVVVEIIRLGYNILINEKKKAVKISDQLIDYLNSMDDLAFNVYLCFSSLINVKLGKINLANYLITATFLLHLDYKKLINLYVYTKYIVYGKRYKFVKAEETFNELIPKLINTHNKRLVHEAMVWKALFKEYDNDGDEIEYIEEFIDGVDEDLVDELLLLKAFNTSEPEKYIKHMKNKESEKYLIALYLCSRKALKNNDKELSKKYQEDMKALHYKTGSDIDYNNLLNLEIKDNQSFYKEYLVNTCFKSAKSKENIFFMKKINDKVVKILKSRNRYKDALNYKERLEEEIREIQHGQ